MRKKGLCAILICAALGISACSSSKPSGNGQQKESDSENALPQTETIAGLIDVVGDIAGGVPIDTEEDLIVDDEDQAKTIETTEKAETLPVEAAPETEAFAETEAVETEEAETEEAETEAAETEAAGTEAADTEAEKAAESSEETETEESVKETEAEETEAIEETEAEETEAAEETETFETETEIETETESEIKMIVQSEAVTETELESRIKIEIESESLTEAETEAGTETEKGTESETGIETETETETEAGPIDAIVADFISAREAMGEHWSIAYEDLETGETYGYQEDDVMQSASVVKLFIMGTVYRDMCYPKNGERVIPFHEEYDGQLRDTLESMIRVSDNGSANLLIERLGEGDFAQGVQRIQEFCEEYGYTGTSIGRRFMEENPSGDNYTTAADTRKFLSDLYHGTIVTEEASRKMLDIVMGQTMKNKIPAGLPAGFTSGNKTGEMPEGYGLGCIENDSAIVFAPEGMGKGYVLSIMSNNLGGRNSEAINVIGQISSRIAQWYMDQHQKN